MNGAFVRRLLRASAVVIAVVAWLDPSYAGRGRPRIAVLDATSTAGASSPRAADIVTRLAVETTVTRHKDPDADAWVVVADDEEAAIPEPPEGVALSLIAPAAPARSLVVESLDAPARSRVRDSVPVVATVAARGMRGVQSTFVVRSGGLPLGRHTHRWTRDDERLTLRFDVLPPNAGVNHVVLEAVDGPGRSRRSRADTAITSEAALLSVQIHEGRPSWTTTFARRALENGQFVVTATAQLSRGIASTLEPRQISMPLPLPPPQRLPDVIRLSSRQLEGQTVAIVGAPETLNAAEVEALRTFAQRGGAVVLAPDSRPKGPYLSLLAGAALDERLLDDAVPLSLADAPDLALLASELVETKTLPAGGQALARGARAETASIWTAPLGRGRVVFVGALDAWRFRGRKGEAFDRWWPQVVEWLGRDLDEARLVHCEPRVAKPGERVTVRVRAGAPGEPATAVRATIALAAQPGGQRDETALRVWPDAEAGAFSGVINAPEEPGVYAVLVTSVAPGGTRRRGSLASLIVDPSARRARHADDRWRLAAAARGGVVAGPDEAASVARAVRPRAQRAETERRFPMRSSWWLLPFAACLGGEWLLRRRAGLR